MRNISYANLSIKKRKTNKDCVFLERWGYAPLLLKVKNFLRLPTTLDVDQRIGWGAMMKNVSV